MGFKRDDDRMNAGGNGGGTQWIAREGDYTLRVTTAEEVYTQGRERLKVICACVETGACVRGQYDLSGDFAWRTDRLMQALGVDGYDKPDDLIGLGFDAEIRFQRGSDKYMEIGRVRPASKQIPKRAAPPTPPTPPTADDECPF